MKDKKKQFALAYLISLSVGMVCFCILYFLVFKINSQTPDNHLPVYNFFGIFYKDLLFTSVAIELISIFCTETFISLKVENPKTAMMIVLGLVLSFVGGWFSALAGSYVNSLSGNHFAVQLIIQLAVLSLNLFVIYHVGIKEGEKSSEI